ncbi:hypothetical protein Ocin01_07992 [Orchesella cincta]|uniref:Macroglobulin domain-containing protein n=1 Tax=Orchesella cincta TaxID=48709 RepID=A0A1D2N0U2_ORCCI|nr:hypothetical protein Ocin01_07992 [Orchesella cincta]
MISSKASINVILVVKVIWFEILLLAFSNLAGAQLFGTPAPQQPPPFWQNEIRQDNNINRRPPNEKLPEEDIYRFHKNNTIRHFYPLNLVQGQQVYSNNSGQVGFIIIAPSIIQPSSIFKAVVTINDLSEAPRLATLLNYNLFVDVRLALFRNGADIQGSNKLISPGSSDTLQILVPGQLPQAEYKIRIEGNHPKTTGGTLFASESPLIFSEKFLSILIQTNRYVFSGGQTVLFRIILLKRDLLPYEDPVDIFILDSRGLIMRRWPSRFSNNGVVDMDYELPPFTALGKWTIRVVANSQTQDKHILLEKYFQPLHEVFVTMDPFILSTEESVTVSVSSFYGSEKTVRGNTTVRMYGSYWGKNPRRKDWQFITAREFFLIGEEELTFDMQEITQIMGDPTNVAIRVEADVLEYFIDETRFGIFSKTKNKCIQDYSIQMSNSDRTFFS